MVASRKESQWVLRAQCNDREALESLLRSMQPSLHAYLLALVGATSACDVLQEVLIIVCQKLTALNEPELFRPWAFRVASRAAFRHLRKEKRWQERSLDESVLASMPAAEVRLLPGLLTDLSTMDGVSPGSRAVLALHFQEDLPLADVAAILEIPLGTVKSRLAYGLASLRKNLNLKRSL